MMSSQIARNEDEAVAADVIVPPATTTTTTTTDELENAQVSGAVQALDVSGQKPLSEFTRFAMMTAAVFAMVCASTSYAYNLIAGDIQGTYHLQFRDMSNISTVGMCFCYFLLPYGAILDFFGPRPVYTLGCVLFPIGALLFGLTFQGVIEGSVVRFCVYNALLSLGSQLFDLASVIVMLSVFPTRRGWVIALLKTMMGLGQAIIASIKTGFFSTNTANYFYFLVALVVVVGVGVQLLIKLPPYHLTGWEERRLSPEKKAARLATRSVYLTQEPPMWRFYLGVGIIVVLVGYLPMTSAVLAFAKESISPESNKIFAIVAIILTCMLLLMIVPCPALDRRTTKRPKHAATEAGSTDDDEKEKEGAMEMLDGDLAAIEDASTPSAAGGAGAAASAAAPKRVDVMTDIDYIAPQYQTTFLQSCCTLQLWSILWTLFCGVGAEFVIIFNARYIYSASNGAVPDATVAALLTVLNGAGSGLGRLAMCVFESYTQGRKAEDRIPITASFFVPTTCIILSIVLFLVLPGQSLLVAYAIAALGNGFCASIAILVLRTIYAKDPAKHYNFGFNALWIAAILLNRLLFGEWYAVQAEKRHETACTSKKCIIMPLVVMLGLNVTAFISNVYLHVVYSRYSRRVLAERRRIKEEALLSEPAFGDENDGNAMEKVGGVAVGDAVNCDSHDSLHDELTPTTESGERRK